MELNITASSPTKLIYIPSFLSNITINKNELWKTVRVTSFQKHNFNISFNLLQVCPSVHTFVFAVLLIPLCNVLSDYFQVSFNLVAGPTVRIKIHDMASFSAILFCCGIHCKSSIKLPGGLFISNTF